MRDRPTRAESRERTGAEQQRHEPELPESMQWAEYELLVDLYKFYLDLVLKVLAVYFAILGAIITFVLANATKEHVVAYALLIPLFMSLLLAFAAWRGRPLVDETRDAVAQIGRKMHVTLAPHVEILEWIVGGLLPLVILAALLLAGMFALLLAHPPH